MMVVIAGLAAAVIVSNLPNEPQHNQEASAQHSPSNRQGPIDSVMQQTPNKASHQQAAAGKTTTSSTSDPGTNNFSTQQRSTAAAAAPWADASGQDAYGSWCQVTVAGHPMRFRLIKAGAFTMGDAEIPESAPPHRVQITRAYWLAETEVSQAIYVHLTESNPSRFQASDRPLEGVSWDDSQAFIALLKQQRQDIAFRLPTEAEWEFACRSGINKKHQLDDHAWSSSNAKRHSHPVGSKKANALGLFDMQGNVMEWCADAWSAYTSQSETDPYVQQGLHRVARGGAWMSPEHQLHPAARIRYAPDAHFFFLGLRLAIDAKPKPSSDHD